MLIHALLEQAGRVGFAETLQQPAWVQTWLERNCGGEAWLAQQALLSQALQRWLSLPLLPDAELTLARLVRADYQVEMEFLLAVNDVDVRWLDQQLQQQLFPHHVRPPLLAGQLHGLVKGFIDLVFTDGRQYFLADYKFNHLGDSAAYEPAALRAAMLSKRYDLQLALYALAVHRLLRQRLREHYDYERDFGGCVYLFLRGWDGGGQGQVWVKPPLVLIQALDAAWNKLSCVFCGNCSPMSRPRYCWRQRC